jgi:hypothetical protein
MTLLLAALALAGQTAGFVPPVPDGANPPVPYPTAACEQRVEGEVRYLATVDETGIGALTDTRDVRERITRY